MDGMTSEFEFAKPGSGSTRGKHRHHHHHKRRTRTANNTPAASMQLSMDSDDEDAGQSIAKWRHEAHVKDHEIKLLRRMVENAKTEIQKKEQTVAKMVERIPAFQNENKGFSREALDMIETLERKLSEREYQTLKVQQDLESTQAAVTERNERIHDLCLQWEKSTQQLKEARERDLAELHRQIRHLEEEIIPTLRARAEAAEAREKQLKNELTVAHARIKQIEALAQEKLAQKERQLAESTRRIRELELDLEHVMAAAARYTRREVLVEHLGGNLQNTMLGGGTTAAFEIPSISVQTPGIYTPSAAANVYQQIGTEAYAPQSVGQQQVASQGGFVTTEGAPLHPPMAPSPQVPTSAAAAAQFAPMQTPVAPTPQAPPPSPAAPSSQAQPAPRGSFDPPTLNHPRPPKPSAGPPSRGSEALASTSAPPPLDVRPMTSQPYKQDASPSPRPPPLPGQQDLGYNSLQQQEDLDRMTQPDAPVRYKASFQEQGYFENPRESPRHRLSVIMKKLKDPRGNLQSPIRVS